MPNRDGSFRIAEHELGQIKGDFKQELTKIPNLSHTQINASQELKLECKLIKIGESPPGGVKTKTPKQLNDKDVPYEVMLNQFPSAHRQTEQQNLELNST